MASPLQTSDASRPVGDKLKLTNMDEIIPFTPEDEGELAIASGHVVGETRRAVKLMCTTGNSSFL